MHKSRKSPSRALLRREGDSLLFFMASRVKLIHGLLAPLRPTTIYVYGSVSLPRFHSPLCSKEHVELISSHLIWLLTHLLSSPIIRLFKRKHTLIQIDQLTRPIFEIMDVWLREKHRSRAYDRIECILDRLLSSDQLAAVLGGVSRNRAGPSARASLASSLVRDTRHSWEVECNGL
jgi:hypothetical protein